MEEFIQLSCNIPSWLVYHAPRIWELPVGYSRVHVQVSLSVSVVPDPITFIETGVIYIGGFYAVIDLDNASLTIPLANEDQD